ncbi:MAG: hypothetical protein ACFB4I_07655 [Cyanophyceae cyanobacterium]
MGRDRGNLRKPLEVSTRGIAKGRGVALLSTLGVCSGYAVHTALAV